MRLSLSFSHRTSAVAWTLCLALTACLAGCAAKNPLMDEPAASAVDSAKPADASIAENSGVTITSPTSAQRVLGLLSPYRINIQQGNFVSREMVAQLKESMRNKDGVTPEQVRFVLGTPLLTDIFHANRWDYLFRLKKGTGEVISSRVAVFFKDNRLRY